MPDFDVTGPDGTTARVTAPEGATQEQAMQYAQANWSTLKGAAPAPSGKGKFDVAGALARLEASHPVLAGAVHLALPETALKSPVEDIKQFSTGTTEGLVGSTVKAGARLAGVEPYTAPRPASVEQGAARLLGGLTAAPLDALVVGKAGNAALGTDAKALLQQLFKAAPVKTGAAVGAGYALPTSVASQYAETGKVSGGRTLADTSIGALLLGAGPAVAARLRALLPSVSKTAQFRLTGDSTPAAGAKITPQEPGQLLSESTQTPAARATTNKLLSTAEGQQAVSEVGGKRIEDAAAKLAPSGDPAAAVRRIMQEDTSTNIGQAQASQTAAEERAAEAQARVGTATDPVGQGKQVQEAIAAELDRLDASRKAATAPLYKAAADQSAGATPQLSGIKQALTQAKGLEQAQAAHLERVYSELARDTEEAAPASTSKIILPPGVAGLPPPVAPKTTKAYDALQEASRTLSGIANKAERAGDNVLMKRATEAKAAVESELNRITTGSDGQSLYARAQEQFRELSKPINQITGTGVAEDVTARQKFLDDFGKTPEKVLPKFLADGSNGAEVLQRALGPQAEPAMRAYFARELAGASGADLTKAVQKNAAFLSKFPSLRADLTSTAQQATFRDAITDAAQTQIKADIARGKPFVNANEAKDALEGAIGKGSREDLKTIVDAVRTRNPKGADQILRDSVGQYFQQKLTPILKDAGNQRVSDTSLQLGAVTREWEKRRDMLMQEGVLTKEHAKDLDAIMGDLGSFVQGTSKLPPKGTVPENPSGELGRAVARAVLHRTAGFSGWLLEAAGHMGLNKAVDKAVLEAMTDPAKARALASWKPAQPSLDSTLSKVLSYPAIPSKQITPTGDSDDRRR